MLQIRDHAINDDSYRVDVTLSSRGKAVLYQVHCFLLGQGSGPASLHGACANGLHVQVSTIKDEVMPMSEMSEHADSKRFCTNTFHGDCFTS